MKKLSDLQKDGKRVWIAAGISFDEDILIVICKKCGEDQWWCGDNMYCEYCGGNLPKVGNVLDL